ncbi:hypothetical protein [Geofilum rhodophaeum]|jgi:hypothetical protein|uniref:hypothetical protein n=1 Tax=Geofilum rhodophaeum TaxID=1965019 RepID=UPI000B527BA9|nr:hypothetical protein [Geofilum rhodophaeum]
MQRTLTIANYTGMLLIVAGLLLHLNESSLGFWLLTAGLVPVLGLRSYNLVVAKEDQRRQHLLLLISALALVATAAAIWYNRSYWVLFIAIAAVLDLYLSFRFRQ